MWWLSLCFSMWFFLIWPFSNKSCFSFFLFLLIIISCEENEDIIVWNPILQFRLPVDLFPGYSLTVVMVSCVTVVRWLQLSPQNTLASGTHLQN